MSTARAEAAVPPRRQAEPQPLWKTILKRPEAGALGGAILVFIFFSAIAPPFRQVAAFTTVLYQASHDRHSGGRRRPADDRR